MDDPRQEELECIMAIFPELSLAADDPFSAFIELPVNPRSPVKVLFPACAEGLLPTPPLSEASGDDAVATANLADNVESHNLAHLPTLRLHITLPEGYPAATPPKFELSTSPEWLSRIQLEELQADGERMWEEAGRTEVVFGYIDSLQQSAENAFGHGEGKNLEVPQEYKIALLDYDIKATQAAFEKETFVCGVCLDPKKGSVCHKMVDCGHVFCVQCLQDFYNNAINEGDLVSVRCLDPDCAKKREAPPPNKRRKPKALSPSELLQIPLEHEVVTRYVKLKHKAELESDKNTIYCPRKWCQGAARSKKHRKPEGLEVVESDDESDAEDGKNQKFSAGNDLLSVCEDCSFAFCSRCYSSWHGEFAYCAPKKSTGELTEEEKASLEYLELHTTPCPTCAAPAQKTHGCNHMICFKCNSHFCYLCSAWLQPDNPYRHYNEEKTGCYMRLWELEGGDGDDVGIGFAGGVHPPLRPQVPDEHEEVEGVEVDGDILDRIQENFLDDNQAAIPLGVHELLGPEGGNNPAPALQQLQREGPLVLRINQLPPQPAPPIPNARQANGRDRRQGGGRGFQFGQIHVIDPRPAGIRVAAPMGGRRLRGPAARGAAAEEGIAQAREAAFDQAWVDRFVQMALNDEEDQMDDSDDEGDAAAWEIPVR